MREKEKVCIKSWRSNTPAFFIYGGIYDAYSVGGAIFWWSPKDCRPAYSPVCRWWYQLACLDLCYKQIDFAKEKFHGEENAKKLLRLCQEHLERHDLTRRSLQRLLDRCSTLAKDAAREGHSEAHSEELAEAKFVRTFLGEEGEGTESHNAVKLWKEMEEFFQKHDEWTRSVGLMGHTMNLYLSFRDGVGVPAHIGGGSATIPLGIQTIG
jgi:hypothetical protein